MTNRLSNNESQAHLSLNINTAPQVLARRLKSTWQQLSPDSYARIRDVYGNINRRIEDWKDGIDTAGVISPQVLGLPKGGIEYRASDKKVLNMVFDSSEVFYKRVFVDLGSGKGPIVMYAAKLPFDRVIGVEISKPLHETASKNIEQKRRRHPEKFVCPDVQLVLSDARDYEIPDDGTDFYFYNPYEGDVFKEVLENICSSLERQPRHVQVIYHHPVMDQAVREAGFHVQRQLMPLPENEKTTYWQSKRPITHNLVVYTNAA